MESEMVVVVVGGAIAGSEAVFQLREKGVRVICIEQNTLPFGKIEDGLPRWHVEQRKKEYEKITDKMDHPLVHFVPKTKLGTELSYQEILNDWKPSAVLLANGAWKDRPLPVDGADQYIDKGLVYQNPLVYWFNHYHEKAYHGPTYDIPDGAIVVGGGLASMDVMKICQLEIAKKALQKKGIASDMLTLEKEGIPKFLESKQMTWSDLGLKGTTLYYRRRVEDMPLADAQGKGPEAQSKVEALRRKILSNYATKFHFEVNDQHLPSGLIVENGRLVGLKFTKTKVVNGKAEPIPGSDYEVRTGMIISSIGSIPEELPGLPWKGDKYDLKDLDTGKLNGPEGVYALGNAVTGKGNIRVSLMHSREVTTKLLSDWLANESRKLPGERVKKILGRVKELQLKMGYDGQFRPWVEREINRREGR